MPQYIALTNVYSKDLNKYLVPAEIFEDANQDNKMQMLIDRDVVSLVGTVRVEISTDGVNWTDVTGQKVPTRNDGFRGQTRTVPVTKTAKAIKEKSDASDN